MDGKRLLLFTVLAAMFVGGCQTLPNQSTAPATSDTAAPVVDPTQFFNDAGDFASSILPPPWNLVAGAAIVAIGGWWVRGRSIKKNGGGSGSQDEASQS
jgi:hypothetical protein